jgi:hypothetical protein
MKADSSRATGPDGLTRSRDVLKDWRSGSGPMRSNITLLGLYRTAISPNLVNGYCKRLLFYI